MTAAAPTLAESYAHCRRLSRRSRSNFWLSFWLLPREKQRAMEALYAFARHTDDLGDSLLAPAERAVALGGWRSALEAALAGDGEASGDQTARLLLPAVVDTVVRFGIPPQHLHAIVDGQEMDLARTTYETFDELSAYCEKVASAVGLACLHIWGFRDSAALEPARRCGLAFQVTNILRDVREDALRGRVYLPQADLRACGYTIEELRERRAGAAFVQLMELEIGRAEDLYAACGQLAPLLHADGRRIFGMMSDTYRRLLHVIAGAPAAVLERRVRLTRLEKLRIAAGWFLLPWRRA